MTTLADRVRESLAWLERHGSRRYREEMLTRYGITAPKSYGVPVGMIQQLAKRLGKDHELALALWETGWYEARMLTAYVDDPAQVTRRRWIAGPGTSTTGASATRSASSCSTRRRTPGARWSSGASGDDEFVKRAAFALLACLALHDKKLGDRPFLRSLKLIERACRR